MALPRTDVQSEHDTAFLLTTHIRAPNPYRPPTTQPRSQQIGAFRVMLGTQIAQLYPRSRGDSHCCSWPGRTLCCGGDMKIACIDKPACEPVRDVLQRHRIGRGVRWQGGSPIDERIWVFVNAGIDPAEETAIRRDVESIAGATVHE